MLIVEDQDYMRRMLREFLQAAFPEKNILEASDGRSALALCSERRPGVVLMDIGLPDANGIELTAQIKSMLPDTAVIIVSNQTGSAYTERARAAGAFAYIAKEAVHDELLPTVTAALGRTRPVAD
jgi:two-component system chemotaxis response regulator CheY